MSLIQVHLNIMDRGYKFSVTVDTLAVCCPCKHTLFTMRSICTKLIPLTCILFKTEKLTGTTPFFFGRYNKIYQNIFPGYCFSPPRRHTTHTQTKWEIRNAPGPGSTLVLSGLLTTALVLIITAPVPMGAVSQGGRVFTYPALAAPVTVRRH